MFITIKGYAQEPNISVEKTIWNVRLNEPYFYEYQGKGTEIKVFPSKLINDVTLTIASKYIKPNIDTARNFIYPIHKLAFDYDAQKTVIVKFSVVMDSVYSAEQTLLFQSNIKNSIWEEKLIPELSNIQTAIQTLKPDSFWAFYNSEPSGIKEIDKIKTQFKDSEGILDIDKLGAYLATKPKELEKYCDY
jgi:hypothetical protein